MRPDGSSVVAPLALPLPAHTERSTGHYLALSGDGSGLYVLVPGHAFQPDRVSVVDATTARIQTHFTLPEFGVYRGLAVGPATGRLYLFGNRGETERAPGTDPLAQRQVSVVVAQLDPNTGTVLAEWTAREPDGRHWRVYQGGVSADERRLYVSYHGTTATGIDVFDVTDAGLRRCPDADRPGLGCLGGHGGFALAGDELLLATGTEVILAVGADGAVRRGFDTVLRGNHVMEFVVDPRAMRLYAVGSCGSVGGFSTVSLWDRAVPTTPTVPGEWRWAATPAPPALFVRWGVCGERLALAPDGLLVVGKTRMPVPRAETPGGLLLVDTAAGRVVREVPTPSEPMDVLVADPAGG